jgi:NAD+ synthase
MSEQFRLWLAQLNPTVGDLTANADAARAAWKTARDAGADMIAFPEMFLTGYQLQDLVKKPAFAMDVHRVMGELAASCADGPAIGIGGPLPGGVEALQRLLHPAGRRDFGDGPETPPAELQRLRREALLPRGRPGGAGARRTCAHRGADLRGRVVRGCDRDACGNRGGDPAGPQRLPLPPGQDGRAAGPDGRPRDRNGAAAGLPEPPGRAGRPGLRRRELRPEPPWRPHPPDARLRGGAFRGGLREGRGRLAGAGGEKAKLPDAWEADYRTMVLSLGDYMRKAGFSKALLGLSGGVDSALVAPSPATRWAPRTCAA